VQLTYKRLGATGQRSLLSILAEHFGADDSAVGEAASKLLWHQGGEARLRAHDAMRQALSPLHESVLRAIGRQQGGLPFLVSLRADVLAALAEARQNSAATSSAGASDVSARTVDGPDASPLRPSPTDPGDTSSLAYLNGSLLRLLSTAFDRGNLELRRIQWDTSPAALLDRLLKYERVHPMLGWEDLRARLGVGRRVFALVHPWMPLEPLAFVQVALGKEVPSRLVDVMPHRGDLLQESERHLQASDAIAFPESIPTDVPHRAELEQSPDRSQRHSQAPDAVARPNNIPTEAPGAADADVSTENGARVAVFYSISAPSDGLRGVPLGR
jgi:malonyl-CoA decarboxylase